MNPDNIIVAFPETQYPRQLNDDCYDIGVLYQAYVYEREYQYCVL